MSNLAELAAALIDAVRRRHPGLRDEDLPVVAGQFVRQLPGAIADGAPIAWLEETAQGVRCRMYRLVEVE